MTDRIQSNLNCGRRNRDSPTWMIPHGPLQNAPVRWTAWPESIRAHHRHGCGTDRSHMRKIRAAGWMDAVTMTDGEPRLMPGSNTGGRG